MSLLTGVKSIQRGTISITSTSTSNTATITSVDTAKSVVDFLGQTSGTNSYSEGTARLELTNATTVTATRASGAGGQACVVAFQVTEYY